MWLVFAATSDRIAALLTLRVDLVVANLGVSPSGPNRSPSPPYAPFFIGVYAPASCRSRKRPT
jgi:hypothetical protein